MKTKVSYSKDILKIIHDKYGVSYDYIRKSIRGDRVGVTSNALKDEYNKLYKEVMKAIENTSGKI
jgi:hypothetical protein